MPGEDTSLTSHSSPTVTQIDILWILAHPDDESFGNAGTMLLADDAGMKTAYVCATRGEAGEIRDSALATRASLAAVREQELRRSMRLAKLDELRIMPYRDSGMAGTKENDDPRALVQAPDEEVIAHLVGHIRELRPKVVVSFGPDGVYGHPDHIRIGAMTDEAVIRAAETDEPGLGEPWQIEAYYHVASPRERILHSAQNPESPFFSMPKEELNTYGTPADDITHWIDTSSKAAEKHAILLQHLTQISRENPVVDPEHPIARAALSGETYRRIPLAWEDARSASAHDPLTLLRDAFPGGPTTSGNQAHSEMVSSRL